MPGWIERLPAWLRWVLVLPSAALAYVVAQVLIILGSALSGTGDFITRMAGAYVTPLAFVAVGALVAPAKRVGVAVVLGVLTILATLAILVVALASGISQGQLFELILALILGAAGAASGVGAAQKGFRSSTSD